MGKEKWKEKEKGKEKGKGKENGGGERGRKMGKEKRKGKGSWKEDSLRNVGRTDTKVILFSVQCYALHWTDNNNLFLTVFV